MNATPASSEPALALLHLIRLADSALPVGTYAHSFGYETLIAAGCLRDAESLYRVLAADLRLRLRRGDLVLLARACEAARLLDCDALSELERELTARQIPAEIRRAGAQTGRALLRLMRKTNPSPLLDRVTHSMDEGGIEGQWIVAFACAANALGLPYAEAREAYAYGYMVARISCAVRLIPIGQSDGQAVLARLLRLLAGLEPVDAGAEISDFTGALDIRSMQHERLETRIFLS